MFVTLVNVCFLYVGKTFSLDNSSLLLLTKTLYFTVRVLIVSRFMSRMSTIELSYVRFFIAKLNSYVIVVFASVKPSTNNVTR